MASKNDQDNVDTAKPTFDPKAVNIGGESLVERIMPHIKKILVMFILAAVVVSAVFMVRWRKTVKEEDRTAQFMSVLEVARTPLDPDPDPKAKDPTYKTEKDRATAVLDAMVKHGVDGGTLYKAGVLLDAGKYDDAIAAYKTCEEKMDLDGVLCREGLGIALEDKALLAQDAVAKEKGLNEALAAFAAMQPDEAGPRRAFALYHQGRIQATLGKKAEAKAMLEKAKTLAAGAEAQGGGEQVAPYRLEALIQRRLALL